MEYFEIKLPPKSKKHTKAERQKYFGNTLSEITGKKKSFMRKFKKRVSTKVN